MLFGPEVLNKLIEVAQSCPTATPRPPPRPEAAAWALLSR